ncbi:MAG: hypothetical protein EBU90_18095 [Proteobacteria bacterium]|jgi:hypothetical protein|nr:hypothetical protein [Pseudomonadota bacterium]NBP15533.1 hypothetical protein [bacterium]
MYLWNINKLVDQLRTDTLPEKEVYLFYVMSPLLSIGNTLFFSFLLLSHQMVGNLFANFLKQHDTNMMLYNWLGFITGILTTLFTLIGFYMCYRTNQQGDGRDFSKRMACLSFPINFHLTVYLLALIGLATVLGYLIIHGKITLFKEQVFSLSQKDSTIGQALQQALQDTSIKPLVPAVVKKSPGFLKMLLKTPTTILSLPSIPGKINGFLVTLRATALLAYPLLACLPPALCLTHYLLIRKMLRKIAHKDEIVLIKV